MSATTASITSEKETTQINSKALSLAFALAFGIALLFVTGISSKPVLHNAAHDARHSAGFPCH